MDLAIGTYVEFGRPNGTCRRGEIVKVNKVTYVIEMSGGTRVRCSKSLAYPHQHPVLVQEEEPVPVEPVQEEPVQAQPVQAQPVQVEPVPSLRQFAESLDRDELIENLITMENYKKLYEQSQKENEELKLLRDTLQAENAQLKNDIHGIRKENNRFKIIMTRMKNALALEL
jgi:hypothetical protein